MTIKIGISPISWQNDDLPDLTADYTMDQALKEAREIGYLGAERGRRMPEGTEELRTYLAGFDIALCGGWCSGNLLVNDLETEKASVRQQVEQFAALDAPCIVYAECSNTVQGDINTPLSKRPKLDRADVTAYARKLGELAKWMADMGQPLAYHHHMGSFVEDQDDIDWLMEASPPDVHLLYDTGHLQFGGADVLGTLRKWSDRVLHVHYKDVRPDVIADMRTRDCSFLEAVIAGGFTVPGDGGIDFEAVTKILKDVDYSGWIVVEAEQDPAKAPPYDYAKTGFDHIVRLCAQAGLTLDPMHGKGM
ncbi:MAG: myo-inosose-2 dehydratase [Rhodobacteraceae bacterium]|nr:myo-inosose-2 dehydratase [Paracoccaceae bacterium]